MNTKNILLTIGHDDWLPIPYGRPKDGESHPYIDLRQNPEHIEDIPEARGIPELQEFLRVVNGPHSFFRTLGCLVFWPDFEGRFNHLQEKSYIDTTFLPWTTDGGQLDCFTVFSKFTKFIYKRDKKADARIPRVKDVMMVLNLKPAHNSILDIEFWCMEWWIMANGDTEDSTHTSWLASLSLLQEFLIEMSQSLQKDQKSI